MDDHEEFKVIHLSRANKVVNVDNSALGTDVACLVSIKDIIRNALLIKVHSVILVHNHPSGSLEPSIADIELTDKLKRAFGFFDMKVLDHIIITREGYYSFSDNGKL